MGSKRSVQALGTNSGPSASDLKDCPRNTIVTHIQSLVWSHAGVPTLPISVVANICELPLLRSAVSMGIPSPHGIPNS